MENNDRTGNRTHVHRKCIAESDNSVFNCKTEKIEFYQLQSHLPRIQKKVSNSSYVILNQNKQKTGGFHLNFQSFSPPLSLGDVNRHMSALII